MASQHGSPNPAVSGDTPRQSWQSPRAEPTTTTKRHWSESGSSGGAQHTLNPSALQSHAALQQSLGPSLSQNASSANMSPPPNPSAARDGITLAIPSTPTRRQPQPTLKQRTPSQTKAMEEEALETLMFMSSPGNSQPRSSAPLPKPSTNFSQSHTSPLRTHFLPSDVDGIPRSRIHGHRGHNGRSGRGGTQDRLSIQPQTDEDLDRILDEMDSESDGLGSDEVAYLREHGMGSLAAGA